MRQIETRRRSGTGDGSPRSVSIVPENESASARAVHLLHFFENGLRSLKDGRERDRLQDRGPQLVADRQRGGSRLDADITAQRRNEVPTVSEGAATACQVGAVEAGPVADLGSPGVALRSTRRGQPVTVEKRVDRVVRSCSISASTAGSATGLPPPLLEADGAFEPAQPREARFVLIADGRERDVGGPRAAKCKTIESRRMTTRQAGGRFRSHDDHRARRRTWRLCSGFRSRRYSCRRPHPTRSVRQRRPRRLAARLRVASIGRQCVYGCPVRTGKGTAVVGGIPRLFDGTYGQAGNVAGEPGAPAIGWSVSGII